ncbi:MAG TPA: peptidylprolyl isomerase [Bacillales bacterium]
MKKLLTTMAAATMIFSLGACSNNGNGGDDSEVIVKTNAGNVTKSAFYEELKSAYGKQVLTTMVYTKILDKKYDVSDELDKRVKKIKDNFDGDKQFQQFLKSKGLKNEDDLRERLKTSLLLQQATTDGVKVTKSDMKAYYEKHKKDQYTKIKVSNIVVDKKSTAKTIKKKLNGSNFADLAKQRSTAPAGKKGGDLGYISKQSQMVKPFLDAAFKLDVGEVSDPVKTQYGWHLIKVTDKKTVPFKDVKEQIKQTLMSQKSKTPQQVINELNKNGNIEVVDEDFKDLFKVQKPEQPQKSTGSSDSKKKENQ